MPYGMVVGTWTWTTVPPRDVRKGHATPLVTPKQDPSQLYAPAARNGDLATLRWLRRRVRVPLPDGLFVRCVRERSPLAALRWLVEEADCPADWTAALKAHKRLCPITEGGLDRAMLQVQGWLRSNCDRGQHRRQSEKERLKGILPLRQWAGAFRRCWGGCAVR